MLKTIIIDDEINGVNTLQIMISKHAPELEIVATTTDPREGIDLIEKHRPNVVFLDVSMPGMNGFEMLDHLAYRDFRIVFTTAHQEYAIQAIKTRAHDYLLKPINIAELKACVSSLLKPVPDKKQVRHNNIVELAVKDGVIFIKPEEIIRLEASGSYTVFYLENNIRHVASKNLKECESMLDPGMFYRCHISHIVNLSKVQKMHSADGLFALMSDGSSPEISRKNKETFLEKLKSI